MITAGTSNSAAEAAMWPRMCQTAAGKVSLKKRKKLLASVFRWPYNASLESASSVVSRPSRAALGVVVRSWDKWAEVR